MRFTIKAAQAFAVIALVTGIPGSECVGAQPAPESAAPMKHEEVEQLAINAAFKNDTQALENLKVAAERGDVEAEYGMGFYFDLFGRRYTDFASRKLPLVEFTPLIDKIMNVHSPHPPGYSKEYLAAEDVYLEQLKWYGRAADHDEPEAQAAMGKAWWGEAVRHSIKLTPAFERGVSPAIFVPATEKACDKAVDFLTKAARQNNAEAYLDMSLVYGSGGDPPLPPSAQLLRQAGCFRDNLKLSDSFIEQAADLGSRDAMTTEAQRLIFLGQFEQASRWQKRALESATADKARGMPMPCLDDPSCRAHVYGTH